MSPEPPPSHTEIDPPALGPRDDPGAVPGSIEPLLDHLKRHRGFDFTGYKRASLERRISRRIDAVGVRDHAAYLDLLEVDPAEPGALLDTILINVTGFFRDRATWDHLAGAVVPRLLGSVGPDAPLRVWCAGCASGEEPYTLAMVLAEVLGPEAFVRRVKIYATDVDEDALATARTGLYGARAVAAVPPALLERWFDGVDGGHAVREPLRRAVVFGRNDLVQDAPISRIDLLTCRNTLIYFNAETQARVLRRFHFALADHGVLVLGRSEMLVAQTALFAAVDPPSRIFTKVPRAEVRDRSGPAQVHGPGAPGAMAVPVRDAAFEASPVGQLVLDGREVLVAANGRARALFGVGPADLGRPLRDLERALRPVDLRPHLALATTERRAVTLDGVRHTGADGARRALEVVIAPLVGPAGEPDGATATFVDVTARAALQDELERSRRALEDAYEELQSSIEELETTNEELRSTNEELEATNEELQSANEELEAMNDELRSATGELGAVNDELRARTAEVADAHGVLGAILGSALVAVAVLDAQLAVRVWSPGAAALWGLGEDEAVGRNLLTLDLGLPLEPLGEALRALARTGGEVEVPIPVVELGGRRVDRRLTCASVVAPAGAEPGTVLLMVAPANPDGAPAPVAPGRR